MSFVQTYIDDLLYISNDDFDNHLEKLDVIFKRICEGGLKIKAPKCKWVESEVEYLGYWLTRDSIQLMANKVESILGIKLPIIRKGLHCFIGIVNYYRDI